MKPLSYVCVALVLVLKTNNVIINDTTNTKNISASVRLLCNMYDNNESITQENFTHTIGRFGNHVFGSQDAAISNVNDFDIFYVYFYNNVLSGLTGSIRTFDLFMLW